MMPVLRKCGREVFSTCCDLRDVIPGRASRSAVSSLSSSRRGLIRASYVFRLHQSVRPTRKGRGLARSSFVRWNLDLRVAPPGGRRDSCACDLNLIMSPISAAASPMRTAISPALMRENVTGSKPLGGTIAPSSACAKTPKLGTGATGLWPHHRAGAADLGRQGLVAPSERERTRSLIPNVVTETVEGGGLPPLDRPRELSDLLIRFAGP